jgi:hypothetical protein
MQSYRKKRKARKARKARTRRQRGGDPEKCIFVPLGGGLGNQLYVYAAGIVAKRRTGLPLCLLPYKENVHSKTDYTTVLFKQGTPVDHNVVKSRMEASRKILESVTNPHNTWKNTNISENSSKNITLSGAFYQSYSSIQSAIPTIREDFKKVFEEKYPGFKDTVAATSAFMHVRKGDYGGASLDREYYQRALKELEPVASIKDIYILSDDIPWCKEQKWESSKTIQWFESPDELHALYLMSLCLAGAIISASTFSTWGCILGADQNESSTIIYPVAWLTGPSSKIEFPSRWKAI